MKATMILTKKDLESAVVWYATGYMMGKGTTKYTVTFDVDKQTATLEYDTEEDGNEGA